MIDLKGASDLRRHLVSGRSAFDVELTFAPSSAPVADSTAPDLFTAVQEQLGLKLEPTRAPADMLVSVHAERSTPD